MDVDCLHPYAETRPLPEPYRTAAGHPRLAHPADPSVGPPARLWHRPGDSGQLERRTASRHRLAVPGAASTREAEMDRGHLEVVGQQTAHARLSTHRGGAAATRLRALAVAGDGRCDGSGTDQTREQ